MQRFDVTLHSARPLANDLLLAQALLGTPCHQVRTAPSGNHSPD